MSAPGMEVSGTEIAVIGMAGRFPGADTPEAFFRNLCDGVESITMLDNAELEALGEPHDRRRKPRYVPARSSFDGIDLFDAEFFSIHPHEAELLDPQHRVFLECAWEALEDAGYDSTRYPGAIAVYGGGSMSSYLVYNIIPALGLERLDGAERLQAGMGNAPNSLATRVSYKLDLRGPSLTVMTGCSTSLVAVHLACESLLCGDCDIALAGGVSVHLHEHNGYLHTPDSVTSPDGHCRPFADDAAGTVWASAAGIVVLKPLADALDDGDTIRAVIRGSAINNDGSQKVGYSAPSVDAQARAVAEALVNAGVTADTITYVEAHGTGTVLGDPIEVEALTKAFRRTTDRTGYCALGSLKSNIGHADAAAGVLGLMKTVLALQHREIPPTLHVRSTNPKIDFDRSPFFVNTELRPWDSRGPRRAGVSSLGIGGTNAHAVVEEAPRAEAGSAARPVQILLVSARTPTALVESSAHLAVHIDADRLTNIADVAYTSQVGRRQFDHRLAVVCRDREDAVARLRAAPGEGAVAGVAGPADGTFVLMFPGAGPHHPGMGEALYRSEPLFRETVDQCAELLAMRGGTDFRRWLYPSSSDAPEAEPRMRLPSVSQPALFAVEVALARVWRERLGEPRAVIGHSAGDYAAAHVAGILSLEDALGVVAWRSELLEELPPGGLLNVALAEDQVAQYLEGDASVAAVNAAAACVVAGDEASVAAVASRLEAEGVSYRPLPFDRPAHCAAVNAIAERFHERLTTVELQPPRVDVVSNLKGRWLAPDEAASPQYWVDHLRLPVRFADGIRLVRDLADAVLLEAGPGRALSHYARLNGVDGKRIVTSLAHPTEPRDDDDAFAEATARLWTQSVRVDWEACWRDERRLRVPLPTYPFERRRYWIEPGVASSVDAPAAAPVIPPAVRAPAAQAQSARPTDLPARSNGRRRAEITSKVLAILSWLSGKSSEELDPTADFFELGFDSFVLVQANQAISDEFGVAITIHQLFVETPSIEDVAEFIDASLPPEVGIAAPTSTGPAAALAPTADAEPPAGAGIAGVMQKQLDLLSRQFEVQQEVIREQLAVLRGDSTAANPEPKPRAVQQQAPAATRSASFRPRTVKLSERQRRHVDKLVERYTAQTRRSKQRAANTRGTHATHVNSLGFNPLWKELVYPIVVERASGSHIWDIDRNEYVDLNMSFSVPLFGHAPRFILDAVQRELDEGQGLAVGVGSRKADDVAELVAGLTGAERVAFYNSGTEAVMVALRLARAATARPRIALFAGSFHGTSDATLVGRRGLGLDGGVMPLSPGIPPGILEDVLVLDYCNPAAFDTIRAQAHLLAAVLVEPVQTRKPDLRPATFLQELRRLTSELDIALVFDEIVTGFRLAPGGAQELFGVRADLATYGKLAGGGMPIGIVAGRARFMDGIDGGTWRYGDDSHPDDSRKIFVGGTFCEHPLAMAAARAALQRLTDEGPSLQQRLNERTATLVERLRDVFEAAGAPIRISSRGSIFLPIVPGNLELLSYHLITHGVYVWGGRTCYLSTEHTEEDLDIVVRAAEESLGDLRRGGFLEAPRVRRAGGGERAATPREIPLTDEQRGLRFVAERDDGPPPASGSAVLHVDGELDVEALVAATRRVGARHEALRAVVARDRDVLELRNGGELTPTTLDWANVLEEDRYRRLEEFLETELRKPVDLTVGPLVRMYLVRWGDRCHDLVAFGHRIVVDGWSWAVVLNELGALYREEGGGIEAGLPEPMPLDEFALWQRRQLSDPSAAKAIAYWRRQFDLPASTLELAIQPGAAATREGRRVHAVLSDGLRERIGALSRERRCSPFMTFLAAFAAFLHRLTGQRDLTIGIPVAGQLLMGAQSLVGQCTTVFPLRIQIGDRVTFAEHLDAVRSSLLELYEHQRFPLHMAAADPDLDLPVLPSPNVLFNMDKALALPELPGLVCEVRGGPVLFAAADLSVNVVEVDDTYRLDLDYSVDALGTEIPTQWLQCFQTLLESIVEMPEAPLSALRLREPGSDFRYAQPVAADDGMPEADLLETAGTAVSDRAAVVLAGEETSYAELVERAYVVSRKLGGVGIGAGSVVGIRPGPLAGVVSAALGALRAGAAFALLEDPRSAGLAIDAVVDGEHVSTAKHVAGKRPTGGPGWVSESGAGNPTLVPAVRLVIHAHALADALALGAGGKLVLCGEVDAETSLERALAAVAAGATVQTGCEGERIPGDTTVVDFSLGAWRRRGGKGAAPGDARVVVRGRMRGTDAAGVAGTVARAFRPDGVPLTVAVDSVTGADAAAGRALLPLARLITPCVVVDDAGAVAAPGAQGELRLRLAADKGAVEIVTRERARYRADGTIQLLGRRNRELRIEGRMVCLDEVEDAVAAHPAVIDSYTVAADVHDGAADETTAIVVYVVPGAAADAATIERECRELVTSALPDPRISAHVVVVAKLPRSQAGIVDRLALPSPRSTRPRVDGADGPRDDVEERLLLVWRELFGAHVARESDFFELGGESLRATRLLTRVRAGFGVDLPLRRLFEAPTVALLAQAIRSANGPRVVEPAIGARDHGPRRVRLSLAQQRLWYLDRLGSSASYSLVNAARLEGPLDVNALQRSLDEVVCRHEALRTTFDEAGDEPCQVIHPPRAIPFEQVDASTAGPADGDAFVQSLARAELERPFDLASWPLVRTKLVKFGQDDHVLLLTQHHIVSDAWSIDVLFREVAALYNAFRSGLPSPLPELPVQYADWAEWQWAWLDSPEYKAQREYWRDKLAGAPVLDLPTDRPRPPLQTFDGARHTFVLPRALIDEVRGIARQENATPFVALLTAFQALLHAYSGQADVVVGTPSANRHRLETEGLLGFFLNILVIRTQFRGRPSFRELLRQVRDTALDAYAHQDIPFDRLVDELLTDRDSSSAPLFQVLFVLNELGGERYVGDLKLTPVPIGRATSMYDLSLMLDDDGKGDLAAVLEYNTDLFDAITIERMAARFSTFLENVAARPDARI